jgi:hypothetical protein
MKLCNFAYQSYTIQILRFFILYFLCFKVQDESYIVYLANKNILCIFMTCILQVS